MNIMMLLEMATQGFGDRVAFTQGTDQIPYHELLAAAGQAAATVKQSGCAHLAMLDVSSLAMPIALFASGWAAVPFVPLNYRLTKVEINALLNRIKPSYLVTDPDKLDTVQDQSEGVIESRRKFIKAVCAQPEKIPLNAIDPWPMEQDDVAVLLFTSGTTGAPKAAVLRQKHLVSYILSSVEFASAAEADAALVCVPPYHIAGIAAVLSSVFAGRRVVQLANFTAEAWLELARKERITHAFLVPTMLARVVDALAGHGSANMPHLRAISYGGGKMPLSVVERAMQLFPQTDFTNAYGLTETSSTIAVLGPQDHRDVAASQDEQIKRRLISVGKPLPGVEIEIHDEEGNRLPAGQRGEIVVRGEQIAGEYKEQGSLKDHQGWFNTRDAGYMDDEGFLFLEGRIDDVIVRGGENISPGEIEDVLLSHDAVADVAVVGIPDEQWGEGVAAAVVLNEGKLVDASELQALVKMRLRSSRVPQTVQFLKELPYNDMGKLLRRVVRAELSAVV